SEKSQVALVLLPFLPKLNPLRWASILIRIGSARSNAVRTLAPRRCGRHIVRSDFLQKSLLTHSVAAPFSFKTHGFEADFCIQQEGALKRCKNTRFLSLD
ncbi:MAG TPA: hypothetical protein IAD33_10440, partial [Candidatus Scatomorpha gallistercoris]|nr:hypothetical protein [Candidatus Scatomorpha gallistercoris]